MLKTRFGLILVLFLSIALTACGHLKRRSDMRNVDPNMVERQSLLKSYSLAQFNEAVVFMREGADQDPGHDGEFCGLNPTDALHLMIPLKNLREEKIRMVNSYDPMEGLNCRGDCAKRYSWVCRSELLEYLKNNSAVIEE